MVEIEKTDTKGNGKSYKNNDSEKDKRTQYNLENNAWKSRLNNNFIPKDDQILVHFCTLRVVN